MKPLLALLCLAFTACQATSPPERKVKTYTRHPEAENAAARSRVAAAFKAGPDALAALMTAMCLTGQGLWNRKVEVRTDGAGYKWAVPASGRISMGDLPLGQDLIPAPISDSDKVAAKTIALVGRSPRIRALTATELKLYQAITPFDHEDPLLVAEGKGHRIVLDMGISKLGDKIARVDDLSAYPATKILGP